MSAELEELAARKQLLMARATLQRLQVTLEIGRLRRHQSRWSRVARWVGIAFTLVRLFRRKR